LAESWQFERESSAKVIVGCVSRSQDAERFKKLLEGSRSVEILEKE
jgi:hypothetical protein